MRTARTAESEMMVTLSMTSVDSVVAAILPSKIARTFFGERTLDSSCRRHTQYLDDPLDPLLPRIRKEPRAKLILASVKCGLTVVS